MEIIIGNKNWYKIAKIATRVGEINKAIKIISKIADPDFRYQAWVDIVVEAIKIAGIYSEMLEHVPDNCINDWGWVIYDLLRLGKAAELQKLQMLHSLTIKIYEEGKNIQKKLKHP